MNTLLRLGEIKTWYSRSDVKFEIIKSLYKREFACLIPSWVTSQDIKRTSTRMLKCHNVQHFDYLINKSLRMFERNLPYNLYYSLARYQDGIPQQTANYSIRDNSEFEQKHFEYMNGYDFLIDIDAGSHDDIMEAHFSTEKIVEFFNKNNIPFELRFSGKGFHIVIPYKYFDACFLEKQRLGELSFNPKQEFNIYSVYSRIAKALQKKFSEMIDLKIYDSRRVCKIPFSLALYENEIYVCYPFETLEGFFSFDLQYFILGHFSLYVRQNRKVFNKEGSVSPLLEMV